ncbi:MAG: hypothetical protein ABIS07_17405 [Dokdonella sp.]
MNATWIIATLLGLALTLGIARALRGARAYRAARIALQSVAAALLYLCLLPPWIDEDFTAGELVVLTPGVTETQLEALHASALTIALPGSTDQRGIESAPDLGTALRRHPDSRRLRIVGGGLPARDRDAARGLVVDFDAAPLPRGVVEFETQSDIRAGSRWWLRGRVEGVPHGRVELRDPGDQLVANADLDEGGHFLLQAQAKSAGNALFAMRVLDQDGTRVDEVAVPLVARSAEPTKLLLLAGAPDPELKYLRRWAADAGIAIDSRVILTDGVALTEGTATLDADALNKADIAIIDERAWATLDANGKSALKAAVRHGLGLLLRVTGPVSAPVAADWAGLGFVLHPDDAAQTVALTHVLGLANGAPSFTRRSLDVDALDATSLLRADDGAPLALWRAQGQGRVAVWWLADSWRLALAGEHAPFATLWSGVLKTIARARGAAQLVTPSDARVGERAILCAIKPGDVVENEQGNRITLLNDDASSRDCAGYWPAQSGWHTLISGSRRWPFNVRAEHDAPSLVRAADARTTRALLGASEPPSTLSVRAKPLPRWPFYLAWLAVVATLWWIERAATRSPAPAA